MKKRKGGMKEQSHLDAMREAVRGDIERARNRRPSIFERPAPPPVEIRQQPAPEPEPEPEPVVAAAPEPEPEPEPVVFEEPQPAPKRRFRLAFWRR